MNRDSVYKYRLITAFVCVAGVFIDAIKKYLSVRNAQTKLYIL